jgi:predicted DNA-binding transcriptional regulator YafY
MPANRRQQRVLDIHREILAGQFPNVTTLARFLKCSEKTVCRDIDYLRKELGAPLRYSRHRHGFAYTNDSFTLPAIHINEGEMLGLFLGSQILRQYRGTPLGTTLTRLFDKLAQFLPTSVVVDFADMMPSIAARTFVADELQVEMLERLLKAANNHCSVEIVYYTASRDITQRRTVDPYGFHLVDGDTYLIAYCHSREAVLYFLPSRIRALTITKAKFAKAADFDIAKYIDAGFRRVRGTGEPQTVVLKFAPSIVRYILGKQWHPTQTEEVLPDDSMLVRFRVNHLLEVKRLALSFGSECEALEPPELREQIYSEARKMLGE